MIMLHRSSVQTWECDQMGHMNVQFYVHKADEALEALALHLGLGPRAREAAGVRLETRAHHLRFLAELRPGAAFTVQGGIAGVQPDALDVFLEMRHSLTDRPAATIRTTLGLVRRDDGVPVPIPPDMMAQAARLGTEIPPHGQPRGLTLDPPRPAPRLAEAQAMGLTPISLSVVQPEHCTLHGLMAARHVIARVSDGIPNLIGTMTGEDRSADPRLGGAALEYRLIYRQAARAGTVMMILSGLKIVGEKTYTWCHWAFDAEDGACIATSEAVAVSMDLVARKAIAIPEHLRAALTARLVPGLSV